MEQTKIFIYVLELEKGKYYVGQTSNPNFRYAEHFKYAGSKWTKRYRALKRIVLKEVFVESLQEARLLENWTTLHWMKKKGWRNVRGGEFCKIDDLAHQSDIEHIFDTEAGRIRDFGFQSKYLFGTSPDHIIYILELENGKFYIGSTDKLGKCLGKHFLGRGIDWTRFNRPIKVLEYYTVPFPNNYIEEKLKRLKEHVAYYGMENVRGGNFEQKNREPVLA